MKQIVAYLFSSIIGGLIVFALLHHQYKPVSETVSDSAPISILASNKMGMAFESDFVFAAKQSTSAVVHIKAEESESLAQRRYREGERNDQGYRSPLQQLFGLDDFFDMDFFRTPFHRQKGSGSGVIISKDGYIATNNHVVGFADNITVTTNDGKEYKAERIGTDPSTDIAVIRIEADDLPTINFGNSDQVQVGEWVLAVGNPFDYLTSTVTAGIVSAKGRDIDIIQGQKAIEEFIQTDAAINPGNSGGALVNLEGEMIGINTAIATPTGVYAGYAFAIPSNLVKRIVGEIIETGDIERAYLGITVIDVAEMIAEGEKPDYNFGVYVDEVMTGSSAQFAGIIPGDIIVGIDGKQITDFDDLQDTLKFIKVGDTVNVKLIRKGARKTITVKLKRGI